MNHHPLDKFALICEPLEPRALLAGEPWGAYPQLIDLDQAVSRFGSINGAGQAIAIIDSGIDYRHPALGGGFGSGFKVAAGWDFADDDPDPMDDSGHGTGLAGVIGANEFVYQGARYRGLAPAAKLIALRVDYDARQDDFDQQVHQALQWVLDHRAQYNIVAVNISSGNGDFAQPVTDGIYTDELASLARAGVFVAAASGNGGVDDPPTILYPAADPNAYAIGAVNANDAITRFTQRSRDLDLLAPGDNVPVPYYDPSKRNHVYIPATGTSFSTPFAAAAAALLKQINSELSPDQIIRILKDTGASNTDGDNESGSTTGLSFKRLDLDDALAAAMRTRDQRAGTFNSVAFDASGNLHMAWYDTASRNLWYARRTTGGQWVDHRLIDAAPDTGRGVSLAVDRKGHIGVAYYDARNADLKYATYTRKGFQTYTVDTRDAVGESPSLVFTTANHPAIAYYDRTRGDLRVAVSNKSGWSFTSLDTGANTGLYTSLAVNPATGRLAVAYTDASHKSVRYVENTAKGWRASTVATTTRGASFLSLAFYSNGSPAVSFYDNARRDLLFARSRGAKGWSLTTVAAGGSQGKYNTLLINRRTDQPAIFYYNESARSVVRAVLAEGRWIFTTLATNGGPYASAAANPFGSVSITWRDAATGQLKDQANV